MRRFVVTFFVFWLFFSLVPGISAARELTIDFGGIPTGIADHFRSRFPDLVKEFKRLSGGPVLLFVYHEDEKDEYKLTLIMGLEPSVFGVDERRVIRNRLDLTPFADYFMMLDGFRAAVKDSMTDPDERKLIRQMLMSIMLVNARGDRFEFYGDTDFFMGVKEATISPNFIFVREGKKPITVYMEPTAIVQQVFILPPARDEKRNLTEASLIYDFFSFQY
jgi:hypothetical protein